MVTSCSYAARRYGVHSAMPMAHAIRLCPQLKIVPSHYDEYIAYSRKVIRILHEFTPLVEQISIDEAFLDVTDLPYEAKIIASDVQMRIFSSLGLPSSVGGATNKLVAKIATNVAKSSHRGHSYPMAIHMIPAGGEQEFLAPLPVREMWGIGPKSADYLQKLGIQTIDDILKFPADVLKKHFGRFADDLLQRARGVDFRPVGDDGSIKSVSNERTFFENVYEEGLLLRHLKELSEKVGRRLREKGLAGKTVRIKARWPGFETHTRQLTLYQPTNHDSVIFYAAKELLYTIWKSGRPVRLIGVGVSNLGENSHQLSLLDPSYLREKSLLSAIDRINSQFGSRAISKGVRSEDQRNWEK